MFPLPLADGHLAIIDSAAVNDLGHLPFLKSKYIEMVPFPKDVGTGPWMRHLGENPCSFSSQLLLFVA